MQHQSIPRFHIFPHYTETVAVPLCRLYTLYTIYSYSVVVHSLPWYWTCYCNVCVITARTIHNINASLYHPLILLNISLLIYINIVYLWVYIHVTNSQTYLIFNQYYLPSAGKCAVAPTGGVGSVISTCGGSSGTLQCTHTRNFKTPGSISFQDLVSLVWTALAANNANFKPLPLQKTNANVPIVTL